MKKIFTISFFTFLYFLTFSQTTINNIFERQKDFEFYKDSTFHCQIKPFVSLDTNNSKKIILSLSPYFLVSNSLDISSKSYFCDNRVGGFVNLNLKNKLFLNFGGYFGIYKPEPFFQNFSDSLRLIPNFGLLNGNKQYNTFGYLIYRPADYIYFELGKGKTFLGDGYRSLILSDNSSPYNYFRTIVKVWKLEYFYQVAELTGIDNRLPNQLVSKYLFTQYLSFNLGKRFNISMFETVIQSQYDSTMRKRGVELSYLNPVIFLRSVEYNLGSPDNVLVGFTGHLKLFKSAMIYGQLFIDEFILTHIKSKTEYWDEKYGIQAGFKNYNTLGIENLYTQVELNAVRPYTYSHSNSNCAYTNFFQPLAHPMGANFAEGIAIIGYKFNKIYIQSKIVYAKAGDDDTSNYGRNPDLSYLSRVGDKNINWFQGVPTTFKNIEFIVGYPDLLKFADIYLTCTYYNLFKPQSATKNVYFQLTLATRFYNSYSDWF